MLKGIDPLVTAPLLHALAAMGHGDELTIVDRNYPAYASGRPVVHLDGVGTSAALTAILKLFPLDTFVDRPLLHMSPAGNAGGPLDVHSEVVRLATEVEGRPIGPAALSREEFYHRARNSYAIVTTGETRPYGCFILVKGVLPAA